MHGGRRRGPVLQVVDELSGPSAGGDHPPLVVEDDDDLPALFDQDPPALGLEA
jgi:hypothetical protein